MFLHVFNCVARLCKTVYPQLTFLKDNPVVLSRRSKYKYTETFASLFLYCPFYLPAGKSCMTLLTMARYEWFEEWEGTKLGKRGQDYIDLKNSMAQELLDWALTIFPQLQDKVCSFSASLFWFYTCNIIVSSTLFAAVVFH